MKISVKYECEGCGAVYSSKARCRACERSHNKPVDIIEWEEETAFDDVSHYPWTITVTMTDGTAHSYVYNKPKPEYNIKDGGHIK